MSAPPNRTASVRDGALDSSYRSYKASRPSLFQRYEQHPRPMANRTTVQIGVIADDEEHVVLLPHTLYDSSMTHSVITRAKALDTQGQIQTSRPMTLIDSQNYAFASKASITLRWRYENGLQSFQEIFYVVDTLGGPDAILRRDIEIKPEDANLQQAYPVFQDNYKRSEKDDREKKEKERKKQWEREMENDRRKLRAQLEAAKKGRKQ